MPGQPRLFIPGATYHVYCRVTRGEFIFKGQYEAVEFVETLCDVRDVDGWTTPGAPLVAPWVSSP